MESNSEKIKSFLNEKKMTWEGFMFLCKISKSSLARYLRGDEIHPSVVKRIEKKTKGALVLKARPSNYRKKINT